MLWTDVLIAATIAFSSQHVDALLAQGSIVVPPKQAVFLTKFCFDFDASGGTAGNFRVKITDATPKIGDMELVLFDDQADSYPNEKALWNFQCGSQELKSAARFEQSIDVSKLPGDGRFIIPMTEHIRPRWWFVAVVDCSGVERTLDYSVHMTNPQQGWHKEFSMDQCGLASLLVTLGAYLALAIAQQFAIFSQMRQQRASARHPLRIMLLLSLGAACAGMVALVLETLWFATNGQTEAKLYLAGKMLKVLSKFLLISILMLLSRGICISHPFNSTDMWRVSRLLAPFFGACLVLELWGEYSASRNYTTGSIYGTWFGGALVLGDLCFLVLYLKNLTHSYSFETDVERRRIYSFWGALYSLAFVVLPFATLLSFVLSPWVRTETIFLITNGANITLLALLVVGLWPQRAHQFFCIDSDELAKTIGVESDLLEELEGCAHQAKATFAISSCGDGNPFTVPDNFP